MLYHKDVFMPKRFIKQLPKNVRKLNYSSHATKEVNSDRYGKVSVPSEIIFQDWEIIEIETVDNVTTDKVVIRNQFDNRDICLAVIVKENLVKTFWINLRDDYHKTLNRSRYIQKSS